MRWLLLLLVLVASPAWGAPDGPPFYDRNRKTDEQEDDAKKAGKTARKANAAEVVELLADDSVWVRDEVFEAVEEREDEALLEALAPHLAHRDPLVRASVAELFGRCKFAKARAALEKVGLAARDPETVLESIWALERIGDASSAKALSKLAKKRSKLGFRVQGDALIALASVDPKAARGLATKQLKRPKGPQAIAALAALGEVDRGAAAAAAVDVIAAPAKKDPWAPRILDAALEALRRWEDRDAGLVVRAVDALIERLDGSQGLAQHLLGVTLGDLTGASLAPNAEDWRGWWSARREGFEPPKAGKGEAAEGGTRVRYHGVPVYSKRMMFALDCSTGMSSHKVDDDEPESPLRLTFSAQELKRVLEALEEDTLANVVFFATRYRFMNDALIPVGKARGKMLAFVDANAHTPEAKGMSRSNVYDTLTIALSDPRIDTVYLLSEGGPTEGRYRKRKRLLRHLERQNVYARVQVHVLQVAEGRKRTRFLKALAEELGGAFYDLEFLKKAHGL